jgi:hypothetical protein
MDLTTVIIVAVICLGLGVVLDNLARLLLNKEKPPEKVQPAPAEPEPAVTKAAPASSNPAGLEEIVRLWDEGSTHALVVDVNGQLIHVAPELSSEQRAKLESVQERLSNWLGKSLQPLKPLQPAQPMQSPAADGFEKLVVDNLAASGAPDTSLPSDIPLVSTEETAQTIKKPSLNPLDVIVKAFQTDVVKPDTPKSLAEQVDEVLQEKLTVSPLRGKGIRLLDLPGKGLVVLVGLDKYDGIDAVPDEQVKAILREAVDEWGRRASGRKI